MGNFRKNSEKRFGGRGGGFGRRSDSRGGFGGGRSRGPITMHQAICDQCGKPCEVPFRPTGEKPVYCSACFEGKREIGNNDEVKKQLEILNEKMDRLIKAVEAMASTRPSVAEGKNK